MQRGKNDVEPIRQHFKTLQPIDGGYLRRDSTLVLAAGTGVNGNPKSTPIFVHPVTFLLAERIHWIPDST